MKKGLKFDLMIKKHSNLVTWAQEETVLPASVGFRDEILKTDSILTLSNQEN